MDLVDLKNEIVTGMTKNLYVFTGVESGMMKMYMNKMSSNIIRTDKFSDLIPKLEAPSLFRKKALYAVYNDSELLNVDCGWDRIKELIGKNKVVLIYYNLDKRSSFYHAMKDDVVEFDKLTEPQLVSYVMKNITVNKATAEVIAERCNYDFNRIELELDKLKRLPFVDNKTIKELVTPLPEDVVFDMSAAMLTGDADLAFQLYKELKERNESPIKIIAILYMNFKNVMMVQAMQDKQNREITAATGLSSWQINHVRDKVGSYSLNNLLAVLRLIQGAEFGIKTGKIEQDMAMEKLMVDILALSERSQVPF